MSDDGLTVTEAARLLGCSRSAVHKFIRSGQLVVARKVGNLFLLEPRSVERLQSRGTRRGRPWSQRMAWAAIVMLSGGNPTWISASEKSRLKSRIAMLDPAQFAILARERGRTCRYRASAGFLEQVLEQVIPTGGASLGTTELARRFELAGGSHGVDGYVLAGQSAELAEDFAMVPDLAGNVVLREVRLHDPFLTGQTPVAAVALDLMDSSLVREQAAGSRVLGGLLDEFN